MLQALRRTDLRWLLIMDNADEVEGVLPYVPDGKGHVVITSRNLQWVERATTIPVDVFKRAESIQHLTERCRPCASTRPTGSPPCWATCRSP